MSSPLAPGGAPAPADAPADDPADDPGAAPLVTFYVMAYRQEAHVREAVAGALAQTYAPLEIVLSDDASPDGTYRIMQEMAAAYDGPHRVILNRNPRNLGIAAHIDRIVALSSGELIVQNAGDDVSRPERAARLAQAWRASGKRAMTVYSAADSIDADGAAIGRRGLPEGMPDAPRPEAVLRRGLITLGATCAWSREVFDRFGPLGGEGLLVEDLVTTFRSAVLGEIVYLDEALMGWRAGGLSWNENRRPGHEALFGQWHVYRKWRAASYRGVLRDLEAGAVSGARGRRVRTGKGQDLEVRARAEGRKVEVVDDLAAAAARILD